MGFCLCRMEFLWGCWILFHGGTAASAVMMKGRMKWKAENRVSVALSTEKPPQIHSTRVVPIYGIAESRFVITVAPQNDVCPQGKT